MYMQDFVLVKEEKKCETKKKEVACAASSNSYTHLDNVNFLDVLRCISLVLVNKPGVMLSWLVSPVAIML